MKLLRWWFTKVTYTCTFCQAVQTIPVRRIHVFERFHGLDEGQPVAHPLPEMSSRRAMPFPISLLYRPSRSH